jgi:hypothetical protein
MAAAPKPASAITQITTTHSALRAANLPNLYNALAMVVPSAV